LSAQEIVNWVTTADGCVHTADADATKQFRRVGVGGVHWALKANSQSFARQTAGSIYEHFFTHRQFVLQVSRTDNGAVQAYTISMQRLSSQCNK